MQSKLEKLDQNFREVEITVGVEEIDAAMAEAYKKVVKKVNLPGFRKGNVPRRVLEAQLGKEVFYEDALDIIVPKVYLEAINKHKLSPIDQPKFDIIEPLEVGNPFIFKATVEVLPEVKLGQYKNLEAEKKQVKISTADVEKRLQELRERHAELVLSNKETLEKGDFAVIDYEGYIEGTPFSGGAAQAYTLEIGAGNFIPGFETQLMGMTSGSEKEISVTFPSDYPNQDLAGKEATFKVTLQEIKVKEIPELNDEFAQSIGKFESLDELKADVEEKITSMAEMDAESAYSQVLLDKVVANCEVEVSETLVNREMDELLQRFEHNLIYQGLNLKKYMEYAQKTRQEVREDFRPDAIKRVKADLVLDSIAKFEKIEATEAEIDERIKELAQRYQEKNSAEMKKALAAKGRLDDIKQAIILEKTADFIKENAVPVYV
ncbi:MAG: trigger factor [Bacillota bacterium]|jgi:trigger factor